MKNFFDCKDEKITEKAFSQSLIISVIGILLCIVALCSMTYAWFSESTSSGNNTLVSGSFDVTVDVTKTDGDVSTASAAVVFENGKYNLTETGKYTVTLTTTTTTTVKGYCVVTVNGTQYQTGVIVNEVARNDEYQTLTSPFTFTIEANQPDTVVEIEAYWGVPASPTVNADVPIVVGTAQSGAESNKTTE